MKNVLSIGLFLWVSVTGSLGAPTPCGATEPSFARPSIDIKTQTVRLSDVFTNVPAARDVEIALAPAPCKDMVYDKGVLQRLSDRYRLNWTPQSVQDQVVVHSLCTKITEDRLRDSVAEAVKKAGVTGDVDVAFDTRGGDIVLPYGEDGSYNLRNFSYDPIAKRFRADITSGERDRLLAAVGGKITVRRSVVVLDHRLPAGAVVGRSDVTLVSVPEEHVNAATLTDMAEVVGHELRRDTDGGVLLRTADIIPPRLVVRNAPVTLRVETETMVLALQAKALQDGGRGDVIRVVNMQSNRILEGVVESQGVVRLSTPQKMASAH